MTQSPRILAALCCVFGLLPIAALAQSISQTQVVDNSHGHLLYGYSVFLNQSDDQHGRIDYTICNADQQVPLAANWHGPGLRIGHSCPLKPGTCGAKQDFFYSGYRDADATLYYTQLGGRDSISGSVHLRKRNRGSSEWLTSTLNAVLGGGASRCPQRNLKLHVATRSQDGRIELVVDWNSGEVTAALPLRDNDLAEESRQALLSGFQDAGYKAVFTPLSEILNADTAAQIAEETGAIEALALQRGNGSREAQAVRYPLATPVLARRPIILIADGIMLASIDFDVFTESVQ